MTRPVHCLYSIVISMELHNQYPGKTKMERRGNPGYRRVREMPRREQPSIPRVHTPRPCSSPSSDIDEENLLEDVKRNVDRIERSMHRASSIQETVIDIEPSDQPRSTKKVKGKCLERRSQSGANANESIPEYRPEKISPLRTVRNLMRMGKSRFKHAKVDEEQPLLPSSEPSTEPDRPTSQASVSSDEVLVNIDECPNTIRKKRIKSALGPSGPSTLKAADFQLCVTIIEARQLAGLNMDPVVCVQVGEYRKFTSVKESTNCPYYNEYFVFDFHMPPIMLFDQIIVLSVMQCRSLLRSKKLLGNFKLDVATVWNQPDRQFYHKWALLTDPDDVIAGAKGYLKCDISIIGKGDTVKVPPKSDKDEDDIEANLLLPDGVPIERQRARFYVTIYRADGLPKMNYSLLANVRRAFTGENQDLVDPYVHVAFAGMSGCTSVKKNCCQPVWNEQLVFTEMFPPLCQRIKIQLRDNNPMQPNAIGTYFIDLKTISHDGEKGFLPTFGPAYVYLYGSTRDYSLLDQHASLNKGMGEGVSYRARLLISIRTEIMDTVEVPSSEVELEPAPLITETSYKKNEEFFLFASVFDVNMIDKSLSDKALQFELSIGNAGNTLDGHFESIRRPQDMNRNLDEVSPDVGYWQSTSQPAKPRSTDKVYYFLPYWESKECMHVRSVWPDHRRRMYNSNQISSIIELFEEGLSDVQHSMETNGGPDVNCVTTLKAVLDAVSTACAKYVGRMSSAPPLGNTRLDRERLKLCVSEIEQVGIQTRNLKAVITKNSLKNRLSMAFSHLNRLKHICEDPQPSMPDIFLWMISNGKRLAYQRFRARDIIFSENEYEAGQFCGKMQTLFLKWPGKKSNLPSGWAIPAQVHVYTWLGLLKDKKHYIDGLPPGYECTLGIMNAANPRSPPPTTLFYLEKHNFQMRLYIYQARSLIGSDSSGLSDPFARIIIGDCSGTTQVIDETLSPTWDELIIMDDLLLIGTVNYIKSDPPTVVVEIFDQDKVGKSEFIGRTLAKPVVKSIEDLSQKKQFLPTLEWYEIRRGDCKAGELLAAFEILEVPNRRDTSMLANLPQPKENCGKAPIDVKKDVIYPVPIGIRPTLSKYRLEVLFWGLRDLKRVHLLTVDSPRVDIECAGNIIHSTVIQNAKRNPNFANPIKFVDVELPDQDLYRPPLTIRAVDCRSFGRVALVGTHTINSIHKYMYTPMSKRERDEEREKSLTQQCSIEMGVHNNTQDDLFNLESCPLLTRARARQTSYGSGAKVPLRNTLYKKTVKVSSKRRRSSTDSALDDDESSKDWWTKYFASVESMIEEGKEHKKERQGYLQDPKTSVVGEVRPTREEAHCSITSPERTKQKSSRVLTATLKHTNTKTNEIPKFALAKVYPYELEAVPEYEGFKEWLQSYELYRGKKTDDEPEDDNRVVGVFKGGLKVYKWPIPKGIDDTVMSFDPVQGFFHGVPNNDPIHVLVRIYIVKATDLHPMDLNGKADPYIVLYLGSKKISDKDNYVSKQLNPVFGKCFEIEATFPQDSMLTIQVYDWDLLGADDLIGETKIDLENRFYSRHRATCGLPMKYEEQGYNRWRDATKPTQILSKLCKEGKLSPPIYQFGRVKIGRYIFNMDMEDPLFSNKDTIEEQMALNVLRRWQEVPRVGCHLVTEHIETRSLYNPSKPGIEQGRLQMWVDMFPMDMPLPGPPLDISARRPKSYEMRVIIWNTDDVVLEDDAFFTGEKMSDIYVKGWVKGPDDCQSTDIHYRSLTGEGNFNWRMIFSFDYLEAEERIVIKRKESVFSWDETECKIPARLELQVWDSDHFSADDFLGAVTLDLNRFPRGAKSSKLCTLEMLRSDGSVPMVNIFKQKRVKGWWPFYIKRDTEEMELTGKVEAEIHLLTIEEAEKVPAGLGRNEPDPLDKPSRPDASFMWFLNPLKSIRYIVWHNYKWAILRYSAIFVVALFIFVFVYSYPGYLAKKFLGA